MWRVSANIAHVGASLRLNFRGQQPAAHTIQHFDHVLLWLEKLAHDWLPSYSPTPGPAGQRQHQIVKRAHSAMERTTLLRDMTTVIWRHRLDIFVHRGGSKAVTLSSTLLPPRWGFREQEKLRQVEAQTSLAAQPRQCPTGPTQRNATPLHGSSSISRQIHIIVHMYRSTQRDFFCNQDSNTAHKPQRIMPCSPAEPQVTLIDWRSCMTL